ncbi:cytochrome c-type biogenesis protein CcmE [Phreatobacter oligotrophus]|jgi:cytochrome c-type biogenesis protein CcmE|uniref:Cytochrome c-type biogenesis protein CcmE n=2 Tax=Phreatobacter oligotrophus TaxID=1122261 RepID=A0A2T4ZFE7_9HYPH|nr:cytochrome c-type biogenesis protein CcmE [Phreatobacter oligotrophus]
MTTIGTPAPASRGMTRKQRRLVLISLALGVLGLAAGLVLYSLSGSITLFQSPTDVVEKNLQPGTRMRLGGLVEGGSVRRGENMEVAFAVTDGRTTIPVTYRGILPDLFREGQGVVTEGVLGPDRSFRADSVLARHDENYMPKEVADSLKRQGHWKPGDPAPNPNAPARQR